MQGAWIFGTFTIQQCKSLASMPGSGMAISVKPINTDKVSFKKVPLVTLVTMHTQPHIFGALLNRDEVLKRIMDHGMKMCYLWAISALSTNNNADHTE